MKEYKQGQVIELLELLENNFMVSRHASFGHYNVSLKEKAMELLQGCKGDIDIVQLFASMVASFEIEELVHKYSLENSYIKFINSQPAFFDLEADLRALTEQAREYARSSNLVPGLMEILAQARETYKPAKAEKKIATGYIYLIESQLGYKIGKTKNINQRENFFSVKMPFEFSFLDYRLCIDYHALELELHAKYSHKRINGEWFSLSPQDVLEIRVILESRESKAN
jgi:hypothetical protein